MKELKWGGLAVVLNFSLWFCVFCAQYVERWRGRIDNRRKHNPKVPTESFLYIQDFHTGLWGDLIGLSLINVAFAVMMARTKASLRVLIIPIVAGISITTLFHRACMDLFHKPDHGYPASGVVSLSGRAHLVYFAGQIVVVTHVLKLFGSRKTSKTTATIGFLGACIYIFAFILDVKSGRFASLKTKEE